MNNKPQVLVVMGSKSDLPCMEKTVEMLKEFKIPYEVRAISAHRTPTAVLEMAEQAKENGVKVIIAGAGGAAHLAGVITSSTTLPVIGVPIQTSALGAGFFAVHCTDAGGIPVATTAIGNAGAKNAGILAAQMIALYDEEMAQRVADFKKAQAEKVLKDSHIEI